MLHFAFLYPLPSLWDCIQCTPIYPSASISLIPSSPHLARARSYSMGDLDKMEWRITDSEPNTFPS